MALGAALLLAAAGGCKGKLGPPEIKDVVNITVDSGGFNPSTIYAKRGKPLTMVFNRTEEHTCATEVVIASEHIRRELPMNAQVPVVFMPEKAGDIRFACPMNMVVGTIKVVN
jgi:plastocyanin domain-containing protein